MAFWNKNKDVKLEQMDSSYDLRGASEIPNPMQMQKAAELLGSVSPRDFLWGGAAQSEVSDLGGAVGWGNESAFYAFYQILSAPWLQLPSALAVMHKVVNKVSSTPIGMRNRKTGKTQELPPIWDMPLGRGNPSYHRRQIIEDFVSSLFRWGCAFGAATMGNIRRGEDEELLRLEVLDATRVQIGGSMRWPHYDLTAVPFSLHSADNATSAGGRLYPNSRPKMMLSVSWLRSPETLRGVPSGMLGALAVRAALSAEIFAAGAYGDWQQQLLSLKHVEGADDDAAHLDLVERQIEDGRRVLTSAREMNATKLGMSAREADVTRTRQADEGFIAQMHGVPKSTIASIAASFAQLHADNHALKTDVNDPIYDLLEAELSRTLPDGFDFWFDRSAVERGDPQMQTDIAEQRVKAGLISVNEGRKMIGEDPYPEPEYDRPTVDKSRVFFDMLEDVVEQQIAKQSAKENGRPSGSRQGGDPRPDYPDAK